jgi:hypothetical protein
MLCMEVIHSKIHNAQNSALVGADLVCNLSKVSEPIKRLSRHVLKPIQLVPFPSEIVTAKTSLYIAGINRRFGIYSPGLVLLQSATISLICFYTRPITTFRDLPQCFPFNVIITT